MENEKDNVFQAANLEVEEQTAAADDTAITAEEAQELRELEAEEQPSSEDNLETGDEDESTAEESNEDATAVEDVESAEPVLENAEPEVEATTEEAPAMSSESAPAPKKRRASRRSSAPGIINRRNAVEPAMDKVAAEAIAQSAPATLAEKKEEALANAQSGDDKRAQAGAATKNRADVIRDAREREAARAARHAEAVKVLTAWNHIREAERRQRLIWGRVVAVEELNRNACAILDVEGFRTVVPFVNFYLTDPIDYTTVRGENDLRTRQMQVLSRVIGLETLIAIDRTADGKDGPEDSIVLGNRKKALEQLNTAWFTGEHPNVHEGDVVDGTITAVGVNSIRLLLGGVEVKLLKYQCTHRYVPDMTKEFQLNQIIKVRITEIRINDKGNPVLRLDALVSEREVMCDNLRKIRLDGRYVGYLTRTTRRPDNSLRYHMHIMPQDVYAVALGAPEQFSYRLPEPGDSLLFVPNMIDENRGMAAGRVIGFVNRSAENSGRNGISRSVGDMLKPHIYKE